MAHPKARVIAFHKIIGSKPYETPYDSQRIVPTTNNRVKGILISFALLSLNRRQTCGMNPIVSNPPATNPRISLIGKLNLQSCSVIFF
jgi:hypothetical protein